jgi:cytochrome c peroxidase
MHQRFISLHRLIAVLPLTLALAAIAAPEHATHENGKKLIADAKCEACHIGKVGGDGSAMYTRKDRRVTTKAKLLPQVSRCNTELNLGLFPEDEAAIAAYLNATHYKFKD